MKKRHATRKELSGYEPADEESSAEAKERRMADPKQGEEDTLSTTQVFLWH